MKTPPPPTHPFKMEGFNHRKLKAHRRAAYLRKMRIYNRKKYGLENPEDDTPRKRGRKRIPNVMEVLY
jgi:hypothetical protein